MILIADSGSTKTDWARVNEKNEVAVTHTVGYNPYFIDTETIYHSLVEDLLTEVSNADITDIFFYGAGCSTPENKTIVNVALKRAFPKANLFVGHDLLAAARALLGHNTGFAAILGTGSNTCLYKDDECIMNIDSLGYLLGDEGSGSYIGKKIVRDFMRGRFDTEMHESFKEQFGIQNNEQIFHTLYTTQFPNRYLADFCRFAHMHADHPYIRNKVRDSFRDFFKNLVSKYPDYKQYTFNCIGSVGFIFKNILEEVVENYDMKMGTVIRSPLDNLVAYHTENKGPASTLMQPK
jgi:glucosamine kinase